MEQGITKELLDFGELMGPALPASIDVRLIAGFPAVPYRLELIGAVPIVADPAVLD